jgi:cephalosporin-C deacetylase-like acetyl esterase
MVEPSDFGLSPAATLAHVGDLARSPRHGSFWKTWTAAVFEGAPPRLMEIGGTKSTDRAEPRSVAREPDPSDPSATHQFESARHVRIGCALALPPGTTRAGLITLHGYGDVPTLAQSLADWQPLVERGVAVLALRVRGYPGSRLDTPHLNAASDERGGGHWIAGGLTEPLSGNGLGSEWAFSYAVADVVNAARALRALLHSCPLYLHGESFGGALAVIAGSVLADHGEIARLAIGVPSMGDWPWRLSGPPEALRCGIGSGRVIRQTIEDHPDRAVEIVHTLRVLDAAVHARRIRCPVLCKLALRDEMVPAPAVAAVFNALGTDPARKWRHVVKYGHFDGGIADMRRHAAFEKLVVEFLDPAREPEETMALSPQGEMPASSRAEGATASTAPPTLGVQQRP